MDAVDWDKDFRKVNCVNSAIPYTFPPTSHGYFALLQPCNPGMVFHLWKEHLLTASYNWGLSKGNTTSATATCHGVSIQEILADGDFLWTKSQCIVVQNG